MRTIAWFAACAAFALSTEARAEVGVDEFNPSTNFRPQEFPWESGFIPDSGPLQINLEATAYQEIDIDMFGDGNYDFDNQQLTFIGEPGSGVFMNTLGIAITATIAIDFIVSTEFEVGLYNIEEDAMAMFDPYVLPGAPVRPISVSEAIGPNNLVDEDFTVPGFGFPGNLDIDYTINIPGNEYRSVRIELNDDNNKSAAPMLVGTYDQEEEDLDLILPALPGNDAHLFATLYGTFDSEISIVFDVTVTVTVSDVPLEIGPMQVVLDYPVATDLEVVFDEEQLVYAVPEVPEPPATTTGLDDSSGGGDSDDETGGGDSDSDSNATSGDTPGETGDPPSDDGTDGGIPPDSIGDSAPGCGCSSGGAPGALWTIGLFGLAIARRRRATA
jgi:MYXO-CTERM domain-containing protein